MRVLVSVGIFFTVIMVMVLYSWANIYEGAMNKMSIRERLAEEYPDVDLLFMTEEEYDAAIIGVTVMCQGTNNHHRVVYDYSKIIEINISMGMSELEAIEYFDYNQGDAYVGEHTPIFVINKSDIIGEES